MQNASVFKSVSFSNQKCKHFITDSLICFDRFTMFFVWTWSCSISIAPLSSLYSIVNCQFSIVNSRDGFWRLTTVMLMLLDISGTDCKTPSICIMQANITSELGFLWVYVDLRTKTGNYRCSPLFSVINWINNSALIVIDKHMMETYISLFCISSASKRFARLSKKWHVKCDGHFSIELKVNKSVFHASLVYLWKSQYWILSTISSRQSRPIYFCAHLKWLRCQESKSFCFFFRTKRHTLRQKQSSETTEYTIW